MSQILVHFDQPKRITDASPSSLTSGLPRMIWSAINRAYLAMANFWNIPTIGEDETRQSRYFRTKHYV